MIEKLMDFMETTLVNSNKYFILTTLYNKEKYSLFFNDKKWILVTTPDIITIEGPTVELTKDNVLTELNLLSVDVAKFESDLAKAVLDITVYMTTSISTVREMIGSNIVDEYIEAYDEFFKELTKVIETTFRKQTISLVKEEK